MFTVVLYVVVIGVCVTAVMVEMLSGSDHQPATADTEPRSPWEPWRGIALRNWARLSACGQAIGRAARRAARAGLAGTRAAASVTGSFARRAGVATAHQASLTAQASRRAALRGRAAGRVAGRRTATLVAAACRTSAHRGQELGAASAARARAAGRVAGRRTATLVAAACRTGAHRGRELGAASAARGRRMALATRRGAVSLGHGTLALARRARIATSSTLAAGRRTATLVAAACRTGAHRGRELGAASAARGRRMALATRRGAVSLGHGTRARARRARIATSSTLAAGVGRIDDARTARAQRRAPAREAHATASAGVAAPDVDRMAEVEPDTTAAREPVAGSVTSAATAVAPSPAPPAAPSPDVVRPGPARRTLDVPGQRRQRSPWPTSPAAGGARPTREAAALRSSHAAPPDLPDVPGGADPAARALDPGVDPDADTWIAPGHPDADTWIAPGHPDVDTLAGAAAPASDTVVEEPPVPPAVPQNEPALPHEPEVPTAHTGRRRQRPPTRQTTRQTTPSARRPIEVVPMPLPTRTRVFAGVKLFMLTTVLGVVAAGFVVSVGIAVASALAGS